MVFKYGNCIKCGPIYHARLSGKRVMAFKASIPFIRQRLLIPVKARGKSFFQNIEAMSLDSFQTTGQDFSSAQSAVNPITEGGKYLKIFH